MTLKYCQNRWKWYEQVKLNEYYHHPKFLICHIQSVRENCNIKISGPCWIASQLAKHQSLHKLTFPTWVKKNNRWVASKKKMFKDLSQLQTFLGYGSLIPICSWIRKHSRPHGGSAILSLMTKKSYTVYNRQQLWKSLKFFLFLFWICTRSGTVIISEIIDWTYLL